MSGKPRGLYRRRQYWYFKYKDADGKWKEKATHKTRLKEAQAVRAAFFDELRVGHLPNERCRWTLRAAAEAWLADRQLRLAKGSYLSEKAITNALVRVLGPDTRLDRLAEIHEIKRYESQRLREKRSPKSVNNEILVLAGILRDANVWHRVASHYRPLRVIRSEVGAALSREEANQLFKVASIAHANAVAPFVAVLAYATGMRSGEIKQLQLGSININHEMPCVYVRRATTKTDRGARHVALDKVACWALRKLLRRAQILGSTAPENYLLPTQLNRHTRETDPLFGRNGFDPTHPQSSWDAEWTSIRKLARIQHRRFHDLRHSYITRAAEAGVPLQVIQAQVGHMSSQMVAYYTHICDRAIHQAALLIEKKSPELLRHLGIRAGHEKSDQYLTTQRIS
jgi:integrase